MLSALRHWGKITSVKRWSCTSQKYTAFCSSKLYSQLCNRWTAIFSSHSIIIDSCRYSMVYSPLFFYCFIVTVHAYIQCLQLKFHLLCNRIHNTVSIFIPIKTIYVNIHVRRYVLLNMFATCYYDSFHCMTIATIVRMCTTILQFNSIQPPAMITV